MTKNKELLLKDLCARLPYGVKCHFKYGSAEGDVTLDCIDKNVARFEYGWYGRFHVSIDADYIKPYLFPLSSMTEEQRQELESLMEVITVPVWGEILSPTPEYYDCLNKYHFDYRGLIPMGSAIDATGLNIY